MSEINWTIEEIANWVNGEVVGNSSSEIKSLSKIDESQKGSLSFLANPKYESFLYEADAAAVLVTREFQPKKAVNSTLIKVENPYLAFAQILEKYHAALFNDVAYIHPLAYIDDTTNVGENVALGAFSHIDKHAKIGENTKIGSQVYVGKHAKIGKNCTIYSGVKIYDYCEIGDNCIVHSGTIVGSDGFGFAPIGNGEFQKIPQTGNVVLQDNVEVGSNCTIDRATIGSTLIKEGAKLDNLIQVAHNVEIGKHTVIAAQTGISGSTKIGDNCMIGGQVGFTGHITIADGSKINAQSGVAKSIKEPNRAWSGSPVRDFRANYKAQAYVNQIPKLIERIKELEAKLKEE